MKELDSRTVRGKRGFWGPRGPPGASRSCSFALPRLGGQLPWLHSNKGVCFVFWFPCLDCTAGTDHQGAGCAHCAHRSGRSQEGTPRGHSEHPAASDPPCTFYY